MRTTSRNPVLLVENNLGDIEILRRAFSKVSPPVRLEVVEAVSHAIAYMEGKPPFNDRNQHPLPVMVLMDLRLGREPGFAFLQWRQGNADALRVPVVVFSSSDYDEDINRCYALGAASYVRKPISFEHLKETVADIARYWLSTNVTSGSQAHSGGES